MLAILTKISRGAELQKTKAIKPESTATSAEKGEQDHTNQASSIALAVSWIRDTPSRKLDYLLSANVFSGRLLSVQKVSPIGILPRLQFFHFSDSSRAGASIFRFPGKSKFPQKLIPRLRVWTGPPHVFLNIHLSNGNEGAQEES